MRAHHICNQVFLAIALCLYLQVSQAQQQDLISTAGGSATLTNGHQVDWILGETTTETVVGTRVLTQGFIQPILSRPITNQVESKWAAVKILPNPAADRLHISSPDFVIYSAEIFDAQGSQIYEATINSNRHIFNINNLPSGYYFLKLSTQSSSNTTFKFSKN